MASGRKSETWHPISQLCYSRYVVIGDREVALAYRDILDKLGVTHPNKSLLYPHRVLFLICKAILCQTRHGRFISCLYEMLHDAKSLVWTFLLKYGVKRFFHFSSSYLFCLLGRLRNRQHKTYYLCYILAAKQPGMQKPCPVLRRCVSMRFPIQPLRRT